MPDILFSDACLIYIIAGIFCATIRRMHICHPYGGARADYYYPARRELTFFFAAVSLQLPYVFSPSDPATWMYIRIFGILYYPACFAMLMRRYFDRHKLHKDWLGLFYIWLPMSCIVTVGILSQTAGDWLIQNQKSIYLITGNLGLLGTIYVLSLAHQLKMKIIKFHHDNYSCERDFPFAFGQKVIYCPLVWCGAFWLILFTGNQWVKFGTDCVFSVWTVLFLGVILHPQRARAIPTTKISQKPSIKEDTETIPAVCLPQDAVPPEIDMPQEQQPVYQSSDVVTRETIRQEVSTIIQRMYLNPSLLKTDVIAEMQYGKKTLAKEFLSEVGFYNFVNAYRLEHARLYKEAHPYATLDEIASSAGFRDRFALNYAKSKVKDDDRQLIGDFHPTIE